MFERYKKKIVNMRKYEKKIAQNTHTHSSVWKNNHEIILIKRKKMEFCFFIVIGIFRCCFFFYWSLFILLIPFLIPHFQIFFSRIQDIYFYTLIIIFFCSFFVFTESSNREHVNRFSSNEIVLVFSVALYYISIVLTDIIPNSITYCRNRIIVILFTFVCCCSFFPLVSLANKYKQKQSMATEIVLSLE